MRSSTWLANQRSLEQMAALVQLSPDQFARQFQSGTSVCITHAGLNTVLEALAQGVPQVAIPVTNDQPGVAARIADKKTRRNRSTRTPIVILWSASVRLATCLKDARLVGWLAISFYLESSWKDLLFWLGAWLTESERSAWEARGFRRRYPKTKNFYVTEALNSLLADYGLSQFCVPEGEPVRGRVRRFAVPTAAGGPFDSLCCSK